MGKAVIASFLLLISFCNCLYLRPSPLLHPNGQISSSVRVVNPHAAAVDGSPPWAQGINAALEANAAAYVVTYVILDLSTAMGLLLLFMALRINVGAEFALAFALSKSPPLRGPRLGLDTAVAAVATRLCPALSHVRVSILADALGRVLSLDIISKRISNGSLRGVTDATAASEPRSPRLARAGAEARRITDEYGLAYLAVKNIIGPLSTGLIYWAIRATTASGVGSAGSAVGRASSVIARLTLGPGASFFDGVRLPSVGNTAGLVALASTASALCFPLVVAGAAKLAPALTAASSRWVREQERERKKL